MYSTILTNSKFRPRLTFQCCLCPENVTDEDDDTINSQTERERETEGEKEGGEEEEEEEEVDMTWISEIRQ